MGQTQHIDLSVSSPTNAPDLSLTGTPSASFASNYSTWAIYDGGSMTFTLNLQHQRGVNLIFTLCSTINNGVVDCPVNISVNGHRVVTNWQSSNLNFYNWSWYLDQSFMTSGDNTITIELVPGSQNRVFVKGISVVEFDCQTQTESNWCWDATGVSLALFYDPTSGWTQCKFANLHLGQTDCCTNPSSSACNQGAWPNIAWPKIMQLESNITVSHGTSSTGTPTTSSTELTSVTNAFQSKLNESNVVGCNVDWWQSNGSSYWRVGGHIVIVTGMSGNQQYVTVQDPATGYHVVKLSDFVNAYAGQGYLGNQYYTSGPVVPA